MDDKKFWQNVKVTDDENDCWEWQKGRFSNGYGMVGLDYGKTGSAHKYTYELCYGEVPLGKVITHSCDNRLCCNPLHLKAMTSRENTQDMILKGRMKIGNHIGECNGNATLTENDIISILHSIKKGINNSVIATMFNVNPSAISKIKRNITWRHIKRV